MIIFYGTRLAGFVDELDGEFAATRVAHVYWLPICPVGFRWVSSRDGANHLGHDTRPHARSLLSTFARPWGFLLGGLTLVAAVGSLSRGEGLGIAALVLSLLFLGAVDARCAAVASLRAKRGLSRGVRGYRAARVDLES